MRFLAQGDMVYFPPRAAQLVLRAHKEAVNNIGGTGSANLGIVSMAVAAANATAVEASKEIEAALRISMQAALGLASSSNSNNKSMDGPLDSLTIMKVHQWLNPWCNAGAFYESQLCTSVIFG
jgi:hypothetical protein